MFLITADRSLQIIDKLSAASSNRILSYDEFFLNTTNNDNLLDGNYIDYLLDKTCRLILLYSDVSSMEVDDSSTNFVVLNVIDHNPCYQQNVDKVVGVFIINLTN